MAKLLVSVRSASEARAALAGGAEIIDVKEPARGSLGMADVKTIAEVVYAVRSTSVPACDSFDTARLHNALYRSPFHPVSVERSSSGGPSPCFTAFGLEAVPLPEGEEFHRPPLSAALGEARQWLARELSGTLPGGLTYCKLGLAGLAGCDDWQSAWMQARRLVEQNSQNTPRWIAVAYADWERAQSPAPPAVVAAARVTGCAGVLFDTFRKDARELLAWLDLPQLRRLIDEIHGVGMLAAVAGGLRCDDVSPLLSSGADVLAIRTAACENGRNGDVSAAAVRRFRAAMDAARRSIAAQPVRHPAG